MQASVYQKRVCLSRCCLRSRGKCLNCKKCDQTNLITNDSDSDIFLTADGIFRRRCRHHQRCLSDALRPCEDAKRRLVTAANKSDHHNQCHGKSRSGSNSNSSGRGKAATATATVMVLSIRVDELLQLVERPNRWGSVCFVLGALCIAAPFDRHLANPFCNNLTAVGHPS
ncbi:unnamed protein product [Ceratitis capitata]|uniref:(Mediterranean fruit fly) hypothetical protein n=1 Tax=Ceratitis capitata TaxID=7213 RepID=A0A811URQ6_CERCA|nr:unnamed protein product [Ceratitis capitata]